MVVTLHAAPDGAAWAVFDGAAPVRRFTSALAAEQVAWALSRERLRAFEPRPAPPPARVCPFTGAPGAG